MRAGKQWGNKQGEKEISRSSLRYSCGTSKTVAVPFDFCMLATWSCRLYISLFHFSVFDFHAEFCVFQRCSKFYF